MSYYNPIYGNAGQGYVPYNMQTQTPVYSTMQRQQTQQIKCFTVSSYEEAKSAIIELDGSLFVFVDIAHNCIYTKQVMLDGSAPVKIYRMQENVENQNNEKYVLLSDFNVVINNITKQLEQLKGGIIGVESANGNNHVENVAGESNVPEGATNGTR